MVTHLKLQEVGYDPKYYPRVSGVADWMRVLKYTNILNSTPGYDMHPIVVVKALGNKKKPWMLIDGLHRCGAYEQVGRETIPAEIERLPRSRWMARSIELNVSHQHKDLGDRDRAWCIKRLREEGMKDVNIAGLLMEPVDRLEHIVVDKVQPIDFSKAEAIPRGTSNREVGGEHFAFLKPPFQNGTLSPEEAADVAAAQIPAAGMDALQILDSAIALLTCGVNMENEKVSERIERLRNLIDGLAG